MIILWLLLLLSLISENNVSDKQVLITFALLSPDTTPHSVSSLHLVSLNHMSYKKKIEQRESLTD